MEIQELESQNPVIDWILRYECLYGYIDMCQCNAIYNPNIDNQRSGMVLSTQKNWFRLNGVGFWVPQKDLIKYSRKYIELNRKNKTSWNIWSEIVLEEK